MPGTARAGATAAELFRRLYGRVAGVHPDLKPWHSQWLAGSILYSPLRDLLPTLQGRVLDVGCADKPYERWVTGADSYLGIDVADGPTVDLVVGPAEGWPLPDDEFDCVLCLQVLEHVEDLHHTLSELVRVLRPGGRCIVSVPFAYTEHADPHDYRRFSRHGLRSLLSEELEVVDVVTQGGIGSTTGVMLLNWIELALTRSRPALVLFMMLLPAWLVLCAIVNSVGRIADRVDGTNAAYGNVLAIAVKPASHDQG